MDNANGKVTPVEMEMMMDDLVEKMPFMIKVQAHNAKVLKARYDSLIKEGFTPEQALELVKARPLFE
ncbi:hypothetical protein BEH_11685 [Priestia filamentosa]|uniref:Uncharacterized protein n=1 Tax=Priestia filamentosa TaxID=1402861 RepID=A0A0H4KIS5_9BACI|nr:hypothetical protein [Priestia filamentosa]AKO92696.1 hypothetical protein BEH_11685 [Priestia filamentosa]